MSHRARPARGAAVHRGPSGAPLRLVSVWSVCPRHAFRPGLHVLVTADHRRSPCASTLPVACTMQVVWVEHQGGMNRVNGNPARHARALYSPVPTLATSLAPEENLFGLMGSLAFEQRARPTGTALNHLTGAWRGRGKPVLAHSPTGGSGTGRRAGGGGIGKTFPARAEARAPETTRLCHDGTGSARHALRDPSSP